MFRQLAVADSEDLGNCDLRRAGTRDIAGVHEDKISLGDGANNFPFGLRRAGNQLAEKINCSCRCAAGSVLTMFDEIWGRVAREGLRRFEILEGQLVERQYDRFRTFRGRSVARVRDESAKAHQSDNQCKRAMFDHFLPSSRGVYNIPDATRRTLCWTNKAVVSNN